MSLTQPPLLNVDSTPSFITEHNLRAVTHEYFVPNDLYYFSAFFFVIDTATNKSIPTPVGGLINTGSGDFSITASGESTTTHFTYNVEGERTTAEVQCYTIYAKVGRSVRVKVITWTLCGINWVLALCSMVTVISIFEKRPGHRVKDGVAFLPITFILTIPTIRTLYVGSPPFGIYLGTHRNRLILFQELKVFQTSLGSSHK
jgi:hypothetical protein